MGTFIGMKSASAQRFRQLPEILGRRASEARAEERVTKLAFFMSRYLDEPSPENYNSFAAEINQIQLFTSLNDHLQNKF